MPRSILFLLLCLPLATHAAAQASPYVATDDALYSRISRLEAVTGRTDLQGRREFSRVELARRFIAVRPYAQALTDQAINTVVSDVEKDLAVELHDLTAAPDAPRAAVAPHLIDRLSLHALTTRSPSHGYTDALGSTSGVINPILPDDHGLRPHVPLAFSSTHTYQAARSVVLVLQPVLRVGTGTSPATRSSLSLEQAYARLVVDGWSVDAGRVDHSWNGSHIHDLMLSGNARAPWSLRLGRDAPLHVPVLSSLLGPIDTEIFWSDLGESQNFPGANMMGWRVTASPTHSLSLGATLMSQYGGKGSPAYNDLRDIPSDLFLFFVDQHNTAEFSNKMVGVNFQIAEPRAAGMMMYGQIVVDDFDANLARFTHWIREDVGHVYGLQFNRLTADGDLTAYGEYQHTGYRMYRHVQFTSGWTQDGAFIGSPLGPDGDAVYAALHKDISAADALSLGAAYEDRSDDSYVSADGPGFPGDHGWVVSVDRPNETRLRATATLQHSATGPAMNWFLRAGVEHVDNVAFSQGLSRVNYLLEARVEKRFR